jgi:hypothetical protein
MSLFIRRCLFTIACAAFFTLAEAQHVDNSLIVENRDTAMPMVKEAGPMDMALDNSGISRTDTIDGVLFTCTIDKKAYASGDSVRVVYRMKNRAMGTVVYDFNTSCQFDLQFVDGRGVSFYSLLASKTCLPDSSPIVLNPSAEKTVAFDPVPLKLKKSDSLTIKAQMAGYPLSAVPVKAHFETTASTPAVIALEGRVRKSTPS